MTDCNNIINSPFTIAAVGALLLLSPNHISHALSSTNVGLTRNPSSQHSRSLSSSGRCSRLRCTALFSQQSHPNPVTSLRAVAETITTENRADAQNHTGIPISRGAPPGLTVVSGPGTRITSVSSGVAVEQDFWETKFDEGEFVRSFFPTPEIKKVDGGNADHAGGEERVVVDYNDVEQDFWETKYDQGEFVRAYPPRENAEADRVNTEYPGKEQKVMDYDLFPDEAFHGGDILRGNSFTVTEIKNESEDNIMEDTESNMDGSDESEGLEESNDESGNSNSDGSTEDSAIRSAMAKSALLHRAGIAGNAKKSSRSNGRSSRAKTHVNKSRRGAGRNQGGGAMGRVLGTVRTAAATAAAIEQKKLLEKSGPEREPGENDVIKDNLTTNNSRWAAQSPSSNLKSVIQSTVAGMLETQDAVIQQESFGTGMTSTESTTNPRPPPGTASMGLLGEVVQEKLPLIPPLPGKLLVRSNGDTTPTPKRQVSVRSSIPHSSDDIHIANLRLSVFSKFDVEQQRLFRSRSVEVLNVRRRRGAVVLVAEEVSAPNQTGREQQNHYLTEMQARIANGHEYRKIGGRPVAAAACKPSRTFLTVTPVRGAKITSVSSGVAVDSPALTVTPVRGAKITSVSPGVVVDSPSLTVTPIRGAKITSVSSGVAVDSPSLTITPVRGATITSVSSGVVVHSDLDFATIGKNHDGSTPQTTEREINNQGSIIGSIECSHQEFRGTMLGNSRPKGSLMYVTEVAVRTDARRCGAGAMLMRGVDEVASLRKIETIYLHVDVANRAACAMYEKCGYSYLDKRDPIYAQFTASLNLHDGAMHGRKHYLMGKNMLGKTTWVTDEDALFF